MKHFLSFLLASLMLLPLAACGESNPPADTSSDTTADTSTESPETDPVEEDPGYDFGFIPDGLPETMDFDGLEYRIGAEFVLGGTNEAERINNVSYDELTSVPITDSLYLTSRAIEGRFNCKISNVFIETPQWELAKTIESLVATGDSSYSIIEDGALTLSSNVTKGIYRNLASIEQFDFSKPWWTAGTTELSLGDRIYLGVSYLQYNGMDGSDVIFVNKDVAANNNITIPYEDVFNGTWTMDKMLALAAVATHELNGDGEMTIDDAYGYSYMKGFTKQIQCAMGVHIIKKDSNNLPVVNLDTDAAVRYLSMMEALAPYTGVVPNGTPEGYPAWFSHGNILFLNAPLDISYALMEETEIVYGFLPLPKITETQEQYETYSHAFAWIIPTTTENIDFVATVSEALNAAHYNTVRPVHIESTLKGRMSDQPEDTRVLDIISNSLWADFGFEYSQTINPIWDIRDLFDDKATSGTVASVYKSIEKKLTNVLNKQFLKQYQTMIEDEQ